MDRYFKYYIILINLLFILFIYLKKDNIKFKMKDSVLLLIALLGGSLGIVIWMILFKYKSKVVKYGVIFIILLQLSLVIYWGNNNISVSNYIVESSTIPPQFDGYKIVQLSDLHNKEFRKGNKDLITLIKDASPDAIVITGDLIDRRRYNEEKALKLIKGIKDIAPIYYVTGNHEAWSNKFSSLEEKLLMQGVEVLRNNSVEIKRGTGKIFVSGIDDPAFKTTGYSQSYKDYDIVKDEIKTVKKDGDYNILLSHRPELFPLYSECDIDLVFSGHAHGGQVILPFLGGIIAPNQGFFPKYYKGVYSSKDTFMVVSRGLGNSLAPIRVFNPPELVIVELRR